MNYDISILLTTPNPDSEWFEITVEAVMDYLLDCGHDVVMSADLARLEADIVLVDFDVHHDTETETHALRISRELLSSAIIASGAEPVPITSRKRQHPLKSLGTETRAIRISA